MANRLLAPLSRRVFLSFPLEGRTGRRYEVVGRPVPPGTGTADRAAARRRLGLPAEGMCVLVFGGSLGARRLNDAALEAFGTAAPCAILHASGRRDYDDLRRRLDAIGAPPHYRLFAYIEPFADALAAADLVVARAGGSVLEVAAAGLPAVLVPYPYATADHQMANARHMEAAGAAVVVSDEELDGPRLACADGHAPGITPKAGGDGQRGADRGPARCGRPDRRGRARPDRAALAAQAGGWPSCLRADATAASASRTEPAARR